MNLEDYYFRLTIVYYNFHSINISFEESFSTKSVFMIGLKLHGESIMYMLPEDNDKVTLTTPFTGNKFPKFSKTIPFKEKYLSDIKNFILNKIPDFLYDSNRSDAIHAANLLSKYKLINQ